MRIKETFLSPEYKVDDQGTVYGKNGKPLKPAPNFRGYLIVNLMVDGKRIGVAVHTLVARAFCEGYVPGLTVNHKDGNKQRNIWTNLEWVTSLENNKHAREVLGFDNSESNNGNAKAIQGFDKKTGKLKYEFDSLIGAARYFAGNNNEKRARHIQNIICSVAHGKKKSYRGCIWNYKEN